MVKRAQDKGLPTRTSSTGPRRLPTAYGAKVTPHIFLLDAQGKLVYRGRVDDSLEQDKVKSHDFNEALDAWFPASRSSRRDQGVRVRRQVREEVGESRRSILRAARRLVLRLASWMSNQETLLRT